MLGLTYLTGQVVLARWLLALAIVDDYLSEGLPLQPTVGALDFGLEGLGIEGARAYRGNFHSLVN